MKPLAKTFLTLLCTLCTSACYHASKPQLAENVSIEFDIEIAETPPAEEISDTIAYDKIQYIAYNMISQTQVRVNSKNEDYLELLENSFGVNRKQIEQVYSFLSIHKNEENVKLKAIEEISKSLEEYKNISGEKNDFFIANILAPYLTLTAKQIQIDEKDSQEIQKIFAETFNAENEQKNFLSELEKGTIAYNSEHSSASNRPFSSICQQCRSRGRFLPPVCKSV